MKYLKLFEEVKDIQYTTGVNTATLTTTKNPAPVGANNYYPCIPLLFKEPVAKMIQEGKDPVLIKASLGVIGRESDFGNSDRFKYANPLKTLWAAVGGKTSVGMGQIKPETAAQLGLNIDDLNTASGALLGVFQILSQNLKRAKSVGYTTEPSSNLPNGTGNSALDISIVAFNKGQSAIVKYCETSDPNLKRSCSLAGKTVDGLTVSSTQVSNYIPNFKTNRWDGVNITSHGYVIEVANRMKGLSCF